MTGISRDELMALLREASAAHHAAYLSTDGVDPEWPAWYAPYLQARLAGRLENSVTRSELTYLLVKAERSQADSGVDLPWVEHYAEVLLGELAP